jgi:hypothetical protein
LQCSLGKFKEEGEMKIMGEEQSFVCCCKGRRTLPTEIYSAFPGFPFTGPHSREIKKGAAYL